jgi:hypothetical protein
MPRVETAVRMNRVTGSMANIVRAMDQSMKAMNLEKARTEEHWKFSFRRLTSVCCAIRSFPDDSSHGPI